MQSCVTGRGGEEEFLECRNSQADGASVLERNWFGPCGKGATVVRHRVQCTTLPELMKKHGAPKVIDYISLDLEQTEAEVMRSVFDDGHFRFDVVSMEAFEQESVSKLKLMSANDYQLIDRYGLQDQIYASWHGSRPQKRPQASVWSSLETSCAHLPFEVLQREQQRLQQLLNVELNATLRRDIDGRIKWAKKADCKSARLQLGIVKLCEALQSVFQELPHAQGVLGHS